MSRYRPPFPIAQPPNLKATGAQEGDDGDTEDDTADAPYKTSLRLKQLAQDFKKPAGEIFFNPGIDTGLWAVTTPDWMWKAVPRGRVAGVSISVHDAVRTEIQEHCNAFLNRRSFRSAIAFNTLPVVAEDVLFEGSFLSVRGKWLLTGAAGTRLRNLTARDNAKRRPEFDAELATHFATLQERDPPALPLAVPQDKPLDLVLDCRNTFNFYHFTTETLPQLCSYADLPNPGRVKIHARTAEVKGFITRLVDQLFPELAGKVDFLRSPKRYKRAYTVLGTRHLYAQVGESMMPSLEAHAPPTPYWKGRAPIRTSQAMLAMNSYDHNLKRLRDRATAAIAARDTSHLPKRFWVSRASDGARQRDMLGEEALIKALAPLGFKVVYLEQMDPLDQVALFHNAEIMASYHGAAFANMIYAGTGTHCIEIGNLHTCQFRWQDFTPHVHVSGCRYFNLFADLNQEDAADPAPMGSLPNRPVALPPRGRAQVVRLVRALIGQRVSSEAPRDVTDLAHLLDRGECWAELRYLMACNPDAFPPGRETHLRQANCAEGLGDLVGAFNALKALWALDRTRPFVLERMILLALRADQGAPIFKMRKLHESLFPERHESFMKRFRKLRAQVKRGRDQA